MGKNIFLINYNSINIAVFFENNYNLIICNKNKSILLFTYHKENCD